jgi:hypothetical protein
VTRCFEIFVAQVGDFYPIILPNALKCQNIYIKPIFKLKNIYIKANLNVAVLKSSPKICQSSQRISYLKNLHRPLKSSPNGKNSPHLVTLHAMCFVFVLGTKKSTKFPTKCRRYSPFVCRRTASRRYSPFRK